MIISLCCSLWLFTVSVNVILLALMSCDVRSTVLRLCSHLTVSLKPLALLSYDCKSIVLGFVVV